MADRKKKSKLSRLTTVFMFYGARGFTVKVINADNEFECLRGELMALGITLNVTAANDMYLIWKEGSESSRKELEVSGMIYVI